MGTIYPTNVSNGDICHFSFDVCRPHFQLQMKEPGQTAGFFHLERTTRAVGLPPADLLPNPDYPFDSIRKAPAKAGAFLMERTTRFELATLTLAMTESVADLPSAPWVRARFLVTVK